MDIINMNLVFLKYTCIWDKRRLFSNFFSSSNLKVFKSNLKSIIIYRDILIIYLKINIVNKER